MVNKKQLEEYAARLEGFSSWTPTKQIDHLAYYLLAHGGAAHVTAKSLGECLSLLSMRPYPRLSVYLSEQTAAKDGRYVKMGTGYHLERSAFDTIRAKVESEPRRLEVAKELAALVPKVGDSQERGFLEEAMRCYRVEAFRATIVMVWTLTIDHLQKHTFGQRLADFNAAIAAHSDKTMRPVVNYDDFSGFKETRLIELLRGASIISNDVRKILDEKLGIRNSAGHPSGIIFTGHKTTEFVLDLLNNVLLKY